MGFKGVENQDIKAEIKDKKVAQKILEDFMKDLPADKKEAVNKELSKLDVAHNKEMSAVKKDVAKEASDLMQEVKGYNELISGNITLEMMHNKLESIIVNAKPHEFFQETNDPTLIVLIQTALQKAGYNVKIDGNMDNDIDTSFALHDFCKKNSLDRKGGYTRVTTVKALSAYLDPSRNAVAVNIPTNVEQSQENPMIEEEKRLLDMPADKLEAAGNALFAKGDIKNATLYYKYATQKQELLKTEPFFPPITADNSRAMKAYIETNIKQYMDEANTIMTQARDSS